MRRGTKCEKATPDELNELLETRMESIYKDGHSDMALKDHLNQLKILYDEMPQRTRVLVKKGNMANWARVMSALGRQLSEVVMEGYVPDEYEEVDNPQYPTESYEQFIAKMIEKKKRRISNILDV